MQSGTMMKMVGVGLDEGGRKAHFQPNLGKVTLWLANHALMLTLTLSIKVAADNLFKGKAVYAHTFA